MKAADVRDLDRAEGKRIVILGAGFAGLYAALEFERRAARDPGVEVLLIDPQNFLLFTPMLHEVASGALDPSSIVVPIREALSPCAVPARGDHGSRPRGPDRDRGLWRRSPHTHDPLRSPADRGGFANAVPAEHCARTCTA